MSHYTVTAVRKERSEDGTHEHIAGVCTSGGVYYTRQEVVESLAAGHVWRSSAGGHTATIFATTFCLAPGCLARPYIRTRPDSTDLDNLENLGPC